VASVRNHLGLRGACGERERPAPVRERIVEVRALPPLLLPAPPPTKAAELKVEERRTAWGPYLTTRAMRKERCGERDREEPAPLPPERTLLLAGAPSATLPPPGSVRDVLALTVPVEDAADTALAAMAPLPAAAPPPLNFLAAMAAASPAEMLSAA
jgi:hypothetical protein